MRKRLIRALRVFRVLKMAQYIGEANLLIRAMRASSREARAQVTCSDCGAKSHDLKASYCPRCGNRLGLLK